MNYAVKDVTEGAEYEFRVSAINRSGCGDPSPPSAMVCAKNPNSKWLMYALHIINLTVTQSNGLLSLCILLYVFSLQ